MPRPPRKKRLARADHPGIEAVLGGHYRFHRREDAEAALRQLGEHFLSARTDPHCFWIEGYALTGEEKTEGYKGHFARIAIAKGAEKGTFTLTATREWQPITRHPKHKRPSYPHPDWRHPLLRAIKAGREYDTIGEPVAILKELHSTFPRATIPGKAKLHIALYEKPAAPEGGKGAKASPITKYLLTIETTAEARFTIKATAKPPAARRTPARPKSGNTAIPQGRFTARESLKRTRKPR